MDICLNAFLYIMCMLVPREVARGLRSLETTVIDSCGWVLEQNLAPLQGLLP